MIGPKNRSFSDRQNSHQSLSHVHGVLAIGDSSSLYISPNPLVSCHVNLLLYAVSSMAVKNPARTYQDVHEVDMT